MIFRNTFISNEIKFYAQSLRNGHSYDILIREVSMMRRDAKMFFILVISLSVFMLWGGVSILEAADRASNELPPANGVPVTIMQPDGQEQVVYSADVDRRRVFAPQGENILLRAWRWLQDFNRSPESGSNRPR